MPSRTIKSELSLHLFLGSVREFFFNSEKTFNDQQRVFFLIDREFSERQLKFHGLGLPAGVENLGEFSKRFYERFYAKVFEFRRTTEVSTLPLDCDTRNNLTLLQNQISSISGGVIDAPSMSSHITHNSTQITQKIGFFRERRKKKLEWKEI